MKVFISWSGDDSKQVAELLKDWLGLVLQQVEPWMSAQDIEKGSVWSRELGSSLEENDFGLLIITKENLTAPWIMFEAGALSKTLPSRVIPILCVGVRPVDYLDTPLALFQGAIEPSKKEILSVVTAVNARCEKGAVAKLVGIECGVVSGCFNPNESSVAALDRRLRHDKHYHEARSRSA
jgi:hypothetical protein